MDVHEMSDAIKQEHVHHFEQYYEEFQTKYIRKKEDALTGEA